MARGTLFVQRRNQYHSEGKAYGNGRFKKFNYSTFQIEAGILPTPLKPCTNTLTTKHPSSSSFSPKTPSDDITHLKSKSKSGALPINIKSSNIERFFSEDLSYSELWAGPAYSNSPPPSSLPIPKFSSTPKRTSSLDLPSSASFIDLLPFSKSAPSSPTRETYQSKSESATKTLCRILKLDIGDE